MALTESIPLRLLIALGCGVGACLLLAAFGATTWALKRRVCLKRGLPSPSNGEVREAVRGLKGCGCTLGSVVCILAFLVLLAGRLFSPALLRSPLWWALTLALCPLSYLLGNPREVRDEAYGLLCLLWLGGVVCSFVVLGWRVGLGHVGLSVLFGLFLRSTADSMPDVADALRTGFGVREPSLDQNDSDSREPPLTDDEIDSLLRELDEQAFEKRTHEISQGEATDSEETDDWE